MRKESISDGQRFVYNQDIRVNMGNYGEGKTYRHAAGVTLDGLVDEFANIRESDDVIVLGVDFFLGQP